MATMMEAALSWVSHGFKVFPVNVDKTPLTPHGLKDATQTKQGVKEYWTKWPEAGIGMCTDGLFVLDFDAAHGGLESMEQINAKYGLPDTRKHLTGGGGFHYIYKNPNGTNLRNTTSFMGYKGVDIRANGGYIIVPPSIHKSGHKYQVVEKKEIALAPTWAIEQYKERPTIPTSSQDSIPEGMRDATLTSLAGSMRRRGMSPPAIEAALMAENQSRCNPPLPDKDIQRIAASVSKYIPDPLASVSTENTEITEMSELTEKTEQTEKTELIEKDCNGAEKHSLDKVVWPMVGTWLLHHEGERFDLDTICRHLDVKTRDGRTSVAKKLAYEVQRGKLEKELKNRPPLYRVTNNTLVRLDWLAASQTTNMDGLQWPMGRDGSKFGFDGRVMIPEKGIVVIAGVTNTGKSVFCRNFLWANMDAHRCFYFTSETSDADFAEYASRMTWANPLNDDGRPKFELIYRNTDWKDAIQPDAINIIDWLNLGDSFYQIGTVLEGIKEKLNKGICLIAIQKDPVKELGMGGMWGEHLASLYMTLDFGRLTVKKAKKWRDVNPNGRSYGFNISDYGTHFSDVHLLKKCNCYKGQKKGVECPDCQGTGYVHDD